ncbi:hypothetical protein BLOT_007437 [Blomia tropicalis]|nr:hypothetical protein BLOT_007437 [Blomia tropicalis]
MAMFATILIIFFSIVGLCLLVSFMQICCPISCLMLSSCRKKESMESGMTNEPVPRITIPNHRATPFTMGGGHPITSNSSGVSIDETTIIEKPPSYEEAIRS